MIDLREVLPQALRDTVVEIHNTLDELEPTTDKLLADNWPIGKHVERIKEFRTWNNRMLQTFQIPIPTKKS